MILDRVTVTGADDSIDPEHLVGLSRRYPWVEWGIFLSRSQEGAPRFPTLAWIEALKEVAQSVPLRLSGHLCGQWVRALCRGSNRFRVERPTIADMFQRVQLNFHGDPHEVNMVPMVEHLKVWGREEYILQFDGGTTAEFLGELVKRGVPTAPLFDKSGGAGIEPEEWPAPFCSYSGYAGGLHPDHVDEQYQRIALAAGGSRIWTDVETHVFSHGGTQFDLAKVEKYLAAAEKWVTKS